MHGARALIAVGLSAAGIVVGVVHAAPVSTPAADQPVEAAFRQRSAAPGETAVLDLWTPVRDLRIEMVRVGPGSRWMASDRAETTFEGPPRGTGPSTGAREHRPGR